MNSGALDHQQRQQHHHHAVSDHRRVCVELSGPIRPAAFRPFPPQQNESGAEETRTPNFQLAKLALYH